MLSRQADRAGDTSEVFDRRFNQYNALNPAILDYYHGEKRNLIEVDTSSDTRTSFGNMTMALMGFDPWVRLLIGDVFLRR